MKDYQTVSLDEARERLPELLRRAAAGEELVIVEGDKWLAKLSKAPMSPEERAAADKESRVRATAAVNEWINLRDAELASQKVDANEQILKEIRGRAG